MQRKQQQKECWCNLFSVASSKAYLTQILRGIDVLYAVNFLSFKAT